MAAFIIPDDDSGRILTFDVIESELHEGVVEVTDHPVEVGVNVSDHLRPLPESFSLVGYTTNTPIAPNPFTQRGEQTAIELTVPTWTIPVEPTPGALYRAGLQQVEALFGPDKRVATVLTFPEAYNAIWETFELLTELKNNGVLLSILTSIRAYEDMVITRVAAPRSAGDSGVAFGLDVRELRVVESGQVAAPPVPADDVPGGVPLQQKGGQGAKPPGSGEDQSKGGSIAYNILNGQGLL